MVVLAEVVGLVEVLGQVLRVEQEQVGKVMLAELEATPVVRQLMVAVEVVGLLQLGVI